MPTLLVMRHAKSDWNADYGSDHDRPLNSRGVRSARVMGEVLASRGLVPDLVISSTAVRARTTAELAIEAGEWVCELRLEPDLYGSGPDRAVAIAAAVSNAGTLMLVGHQPTWSQLVASLSGVGADMRTATVAVLEVPGPGWKGIARSGGALVEVIQPRDHL